MTDDHGDVVSSEPTKPPDRLDRRGLPRPDERTTMVIVLLGVMVGALLLATVLGYVVYHALTEQPRTTVGLGGSSQQLVASPPSTAVAVRVLDAHP
jgi:hypothetical protein